MYQEPLSLAIAISGMLIIPFIAYIFFKNTVLDITMLKSNPWPLILYGQLFLVLVPLLVVNFKGIDNIQILYVAQPGQELVVTVITIFTLLTYVIFLGIFLRFWGLYRSKVLPPNAAKKIFNAHSAVWGVSLVALLLLGIFHVMGYKHAFLFSIIENKSVIFIRLFNKYQSHVPSQLASALLVAGYVIAVLGGYLHRLGRKEGWIYLAVALFVLAAPGDKAPPIKGFLLWMLASGTFLPRKALSLRAIVFLSLILVTAGVGIYLVLLRQIPDLNTSVFIEYLINRLGVGQMAGMFETYGLYEGEGIPGGEYFWHIIPGAKLFINYIDYQKALMMLTEGYSYTNMGVKNTYFVAEAWAIGGILLAFLSPIIVAFSYASGLFFYLRLSSWVFGQELGSIIAIPIYIMGLDITGGFSPFPLFKGFLLLSIQLVLVGVLPLLQRELHRLAKEALSNIR